MIVCEGCLKDAILPTLRHFQHTYGTSIFGNEIFMYVRSVGMLEGSIG